MAFSVSSCCIYTESLINVQVSNTLESNAPKIETIFEIATWGILIMYDRGHGCLKMILEKLSNSSKWGNKDINVSALFHFQQHFPISMINVKVNSKVGGSISHYESPSINKSHSLSTFIYLTESQHYFIGFDFEFLMYQMMQTGRTVIGDHMDTILK